MDHDRQDVSTPAPRCPAGIMPVAVSLSNAPPTATPSSVMGQQTGRGGQCGVGHAVQSPSSLPGSGEGLTLPPTPRGRGLARSDPIEGIDIRSEPLRLSALVDASIPVRGMTLHFEPSRPGSSAQKLSSREIWVELIEGQQNARMIISSQPAHSAVTAGAHCVMRPYGINHREHARPL